MIQDYLKQLYNIEELMKIDGELISIIQLKKILKKKSDSSIVHLIQSGKLKSLKLLGKTYVTKPDLYLYFCPVLDESKKKENTDYQLDPHYKEFFGIKEYNTAEIQKPKEVKTLKGKKQILTDDKNEGTNKTNAGALRIRIKM
jgi:hypothetical protein